jgi:hypothetical protein
MPFLLQSCALYRFHFKIAHFMIKAQGGHRPPLAQRACNRQAVPALPEFAVSSEPWRVAAAR